MSGNALAQEKLVKLKGPQIRAAIAGMQITDEVHWRDVYERSGKLRVSTHGLRSVEHVGGLDNWLLKTSDEKLSLKARKLKREIAKKAAEQA